MNRERWRRIEALYHAAREHGPHVLLEADPELRREVERLLVQDSGGKILDQPAAELLKESTVTQLGLAGQTVSHYRIIEKVGGGGMGVVYRAKDTRLDRFVALKFLWGEFSRDPEALNRFQREARAASALNHPNICTIHDIGEQDGRSFITMEYVPGKTLDDLIPRSGMALCELLKIAIQVAEGLSAAHAAGIIHRDLKPSNIMVSENGLVKILDFGLAKRLPIAGPAETGDIATAGISTPGQIMGTIMYMSPEQVLGQEIDPRSDLFAFGIVLYEMIAGCHPWPSKPAIETMHAILHDAPPPIDSPASGADLPTALQRIVRRCLAKRPTERFQTARELRAALDQASAEVISKPTEYDRSEGRLDPVLIDFPKGGFSPIFSPGAAGRSPAGHRSQSQLTGRPHRRRVACLYHRDPRRVASLPLGYCCPRDSRPANVRRGSGYRSGFITRWKSARFRFRPLRRWQLRHLGTASRRE
jgi:serine/threonine protein kinase